MTRLMIMGLMLAISMALTAQAEERTMLSVEDAVWNAQVGARSIPAQQTGQISVEEAMMPLSAPAQRQMLSVQDSLWNAQMNGQATFGQPAQPLYYQNDTLYAQAVYAPSYTVAPQYAYAPQVYQPQSYPVQPATYYVSAPVAASYPYVIPQPMRLTHPAAIMSPVAQIVAAVRVAPTRQTAKQQPTQQHTAQTDQTVNGEQSAETSLADISQLTVKTAAGETQLVLSNQANTAQIEALKTVSQQAIRQAEIQRAKTLLWIGALISAPLVLAIGWSTKHILAEIRLMAETRREYELIQQRESRKELEAAQRLIDDHR